MVGAWALINVVISRRRKKKDPKGISEYKKCTAYQQLYRLPFPNCASLKLKLIRRVNYRGTKKWLFHFIYLFCGLGITVWGGGKVLIDTDFIMKYLCNNKTCKSPCFGDSTGLRLTEWWSCESSFLLWQYFKTFPYKMRILSFGL